MSGAMVCHSATCVWDQSSWHWWAATASTACVARLGAVADWWRSWPMANALACLCSCQWWTFWTYFVTINLFSLYLMNFMFHTMLDAAGNILSRVHYKSTKCDVSFSKMTVITLICKLTINANQWLQVCTDNMTDRKSKRDRARRKKDVQYRYNYEWHKK